jgi:hypothetical protein
LFLRVDNIDQLVQQHVRQELLSFRPFKKARATPTPISPADAFKQMSENGSRWTHPPADTRAEEVKATQAFSKTFVEKQETSGLDRAIFDEITVLAKYLKSPYDLRLTKEKYFLGGKAPDYSFFFDSQDPFLTAYVVALGDAKSLKANKFTSTDIGQVLNYGEQILYVQKWRKYVVVFLIDGSIIQFFKVLKTSSGFSYYFSDPESCSHGKPGFLFLCDLLKCPVPPPPRPEFSKHRVAVDGFLGEGAVSCVYAATNDAHTTKSNRWALKNFIDEKTSFEDYTIEVENLERVQGPGVPVLVAKAFPFILLQPVMRHFNEICVSRSLILSLMETLERVHKLEIVHRDIRPCNILFDSDCPYINDWNTAANAYAPVKYKGTTSYASPRLLDLFIADPTQNIAPTPADDLHSFVRCIFTFLNPSAEEKITPNVHNYHAIKAFWETHLDNAVWQPIDAAASALNYSQLAKLLSVLFVS